MLSCWLLGGWLRSIMWTTAFDCGWQVVAAHAIISNINGTLRVRCLLWKGIGLLCWLWRAALLSILRHICAAGAAWSHCHHA
jgi:hypothetical protein